jgi:hypothetical protein
MKDKKVEDENDQLLADKKRTGLAEFGRSIVTSVIFFILKN